MERKQAEAQGRAGDRTQRTAFRVRYETAAELLEAFERELLHGALFVATSDAHAPGTAIRVTLDLAFCDRRIHVDGLVVAPRPSPLAAVAPGVSLRFTEVPDELRRRLSEASGLALPEPDPTPPGLTPRAPRFQAVAPVEIETKDRRFVGETANLSYNGMLALVSEPELANGTRLKLRIELAGEGTRLELAGTVANQTPCDHGVQALGVHFIYDLGRFNEVSQFVDTLRSLHHARSLAALAGSLRDVPLDTVLQTFAGASSAGTLVLRRGSDEGRIAYREGAILYAIAGLETGERALARMFCWTDARFQLNPDIEPLDTESTPMPLDSAMLLAAVERDELERLDLGGLGAETIFAIDEQRLGALEGSLDEVSRELVANAAIGFPLVTLVDMASASDAQVYKAISELVDAGVLRMATS